MKKYPDGHKEYNDVEQAVLMDELGHCWYTGIADKIIKELHPITLPYAPKKKKYIVHGCSFKHDPETCKVWFDPSTYTMIYLDYYEDLEGKKHKLRKVFEITEHNMVEVTNEDKKNLLIKNLKPAIKQSRDNHKKWLNQCENE